MLTGVPSFASVKEVLPALREIARGLGIVDPFERAPGSRPYTAGTKLDALVDLEALDHVVEAAVSGRSLTGGPGRREPTDAGELKALWEMPERQTVRGK